MSATDAEAAVEAAAATAASVDAHSRGIVSTSSLLVVRRLIVTIGSAVATGVIARALTPDLFGVYSAALATFYLAQAFGDLGFGAVLARELAVRTQERPALLRAVLRPAVAWSVTVAVALAVFAVVTSDGVRLACLVVLAVAVAVTGAAVSRQWFIVHYDVRLMALVDTVCNLAQVAALIVIALLGGGPVLLAAAVASTAVVNTVIVSVRAARHSGPATVPSGAGWAAVRMALPIGIPSVLASAYFSVDLVLAGYLVPATQVADYAAAVKLLTLVTVLPSLLLGVALPGFAALGEAGRESLGALVARIWHWLVAVALPTCVALAFFAPLAIELFFGRQYAASAPPLRVLMAAGVLTLLGNVFGMLLVATRRAMATLYQNVVALGANVALNIVLLPRYGIMAAAWLTLATEVLLVVCSFLLLRRALVWRPFVQVTRVPALAAGVLAACSFLPVENDVVRAAVAGTAFLVVMTVGRGWPFDVSALARSGRARLQRKGTS